MNSDGDGSKFKPQKGPQIETLVLTVFYHLIIGVPNDLTYTIYTHI